MTEETKNAQIPEAESSAPERTPNEPLTASDKLNSVKEAIKKADAQAKARKAEEKKQREEAEKEQQQLAEAAKARKAEDEERARLAKEKKLAELSYAENYRQKLKAERELKESSANKIKAQLKKEEEEERRREEAERALDESAQSEREEAERRNAQSDELLRRIEERKMRLEEQRSNAAEAEEPKREAPKKSSRSPMKDGPIIVTTEGMELIAPEPEDDFDIPDVAPINAVGTESSAKSVKAAESTDASESSARHERKPNKERASAPDDFVISIEETVLVEPEPVEEEPKPEPVEEEPKPEPAEEPIAEEEPVYDPLADYLSGLGTYDMLTAKTDFGIDGQSDLDTVDEGDGKASVYTPEIDNADRKYDAAYVLRKEEFEIPKKNKKDKNAPAVAVAAAPEGKIAQSDDGKGGTVAAAVVLGANGNDESNGNGTTAVAAAPESDDETEKDDSGMGKTVAAAAAGAVAVAAVAAAKSAADKKNRKNENKEESAGTERDAENGSQARNESEENTAPEAAGVPETDAAPLSSREETQGTEESTSEKTGETPTHEKSADKRNKKAKEKPTKAEKKAEKRTAAVDTQAEEPISESAKNSSESVPSSIMAAGAVANGKTAAQVGKAAPVTASEQSAEGAEIGAMEAAYQDEIARLNARMAELEYAQSKKEQDLKNTIENYERRLAASAEMAKNPGYYDQGAAVADYRGDSAEGITSDAKQAKKDKKSENSELKKEADAIHAAMAITGISMHEYKKQLKLSDKREKKLIAREKKILSKEKKKSGDELAVLETDRLYVKKLLLESYAGDYRLALAYGTKSQKKKYKKLVERTVAEYNGDIDSWSRITGDYSPKCPETLCDDIENDRPISVPTATYFPAEKREPAANEKAKSKKQANTRPVTDVTKEADAIAAAMAITGISAHEYKKQMKLADKREKSLIAKEKKILSKEKNKNTEQLAVLETERLGVKKLLLESYVNDYRLTLACGSKSQKKRYRKLVKDTAAEYNSDIDRWSELTGTVSPKCTEQICEDVENDKHVYIPEITYTPEAPSKTESRKPTKKEKAMMARECSRIAAEDERRNKQLAVSEKPQNNNVSADLASAKPILSKDRETTEARIAYRICRIEDELTARHYRFAEDKSKDKRAKSEAKRKIKALSSSKKKLLKSERADSERCLEVIGTDTSSVKAPRKADRARMEELRRRILSLISQKEEVNARLLSLYKNNDSAVTRGSGKNVSKKISAVKLRATKKAFNSQRSTYKKVERMRVTRSRKEDIYALMDKKTALKAHLAECEYRVKHERPKGSARSALTADIKRTKNNIKSTEREIKIFLKRAEKRSRKVPSKSSMATCAIVLLLIAAAAVAIYVFREPIFAFIKNVLAGFGVNL